MKNAPVDLSAKSVVLTGGSMGIGAAVARACLESGANVTICARGAPTLEATALQLREAFPNRVAALTADVSDAAQVSALFDGAERRFGRVHGAIHCAAVIEPIGTILDVDPGEWLRTLHIDLFGTFVLAREACLRMRARGGRIVLFAGGGASTPYPSHTAYACSKVAVVRFAETAAIEMRPFGIEINALAPGLVLTRMVETTRRSGVDTSGAPAPVGPELAARAAAFLVSDAASGITGKFVSAVHDDYARWPHHLDELQDGDAFTLRRIVPRDRGMDWQ
ncbi:MAG: SDR family oxidoreductase [Candidatus Eremiobacteraeota bacterium]|nr:SDR family oxidoreductase [Candidatus Eremiobacteraeota bacterium]